MACTMQMIAQSKRRRGAPRSDRRAATVVTHGVHALTASGLAQVLQAPLPEVPVDVGVVMHWLAVDGRQVSYTNTVPSWIELR